MTNGTKEAFKRAALYQSCKQSSILSNIDFENTSTDALVDLVNHYNSQSIRELPIILSKMVVKGALTFVTNKYPKARSYINPENIRVRVEDDEMAHLIGTSTKRSTNLVTLVVKNLAVSALGSSIEEIRRELLEGQSSTDSTTNAAAKITVQANIPEEMTLVEPPSVYSNFGSPTVAVDNDNVYDDEAQKETITTTNDDYETRKGTTTNDVYETQKGTMTNDVYDVFVNTDGQKDRSNAEPSNPICSNVESSNRSNDEPLDSIRSNENRATRPSDDENLAGGGTICAKRRANDDGEIERSPPKRTKPASPEIGRAHV